MNRHQPIRFGPPPTPAASADAIEPLLVSALEAARLLSISERKLREMTKAGGVPVVRIHRHVMYSVDALRAWVAMHALSSLATDVPADARRVERSGAH